MSYNTIKVSGDNGSITVTPNQPLYAKGTKITLTAVPNSGYKFDSWCGSSTDTTGTFETTVNEDMSISAHFISDIFSAESELNGLEGYASVSDDNGTKYTITGGFGGQTITISSLEELNSNKSKISGNEPYIIKITARIKASEWIDGTEYNRQKGNLKNKKKSDGTQKYTDEEIKFMLDNRSTYFDIGSNKTIIGEAGKDYGFHNINPKISGENVIIKNLHFGDVIGDDYFGGSGNDALSIKGGSHVWIDHCEFSSSLEPKDYEGNKLVVSETGTNYVKIGDYKISVDMEGESTTADVKWAKDFYDGLLDVSETSRFVSVSNSYFHDHWKACLCGGSNDYASSQPQGSLVRLTMYNNYFENIHARQPLFRFGKAHVYSSYIKGVSDGSSTGIEVRAESQVYVDNVYFDNIKSGREVGCWNSSSGLEAGTWVVKDCSGTSVSSNNTTYTPPYTWTKTSADTSKTNLPTSAGIQK